MTRCWLQLPPHRTLLPKSPGSPLQPHSGLSFNKRTRCYRWFSQASRSLETLIIMYVLQGAISHLLVSEEAGANALTCLQCLAGWYFNLYVGLLNYYNFFRLLTALTSFYRSGDASSLRSLALSQVRSSRAQGFMHKLSSWFVHCYLTCTLMSDNNAYACQITMYTHVRSQCTRM